LRDHSDVSEVGIFFNIIVIPLIIFVDHFLHIFLR
jgi:hypothetical protein